jgi:hypothetical protein
MNIVKQRIKYITKNYNKEYIDYLKTEFSKYKNIILSIFIYDKLKRDVYENSILVILYLEKYDKNILDNNFSLLDIKNITQICLVNVPLNINIKNDFDLTKNNLIEIISSNISVRAYKKTLKKFIKILNNTINEVKNHIKNYIKTYNIYVYDLKDDI